MTFTFKPANSFTERAGLFVSLTGATNAGKTFSALRLARGIAGPNGKIAVLDTEGGRTLHLKREFGFDANLMDPPFHPQRFADAAKDAEDAGYACMLIDSFSMEWVGLGGVLDWQDAELEGMVKRALARNDKRSEYAIREASKMASWIKPKMAHKAMVYSLLQRRMPIVFAIRGEESTKPGENGAKPTSIFKSICNKHFPFEVTVSFRLDSERKGYIDLSDPKSWKMEGSHQGIFLDGDRISEEHGHALAEWACGGGSATPEKIDNRAMFLKEDGDKFASRGKSAFAKFWNGLDREQRILVGGTPQRDIWIDVAKKADETPRPIDDDMNLPDDFDDQTPSPASVFTSAAERDEAAAGSAFPVERRAEPTSDLEGSAPDPQRSQTADDIPIASSAEDAEDCRNQSSASTPQSIPESAPPSLSGSTSSSTRTRAGADRPSPPKAVSAPATSPTPPREPVASDNDDPDSPEAVAREREARIAVIKVDGAATAAKGEAALNNYLEELVASGERSMIENATVREWRKAAREMKKP